MVVRNRSRASVLSAWLLVAGLGLPLPSLAAAIDDAAAGLAAFQRGEHPEAITLFTRAIASGELAGNNLAAVHTNRALALSARGNHAEALADFEQALKLRPESAAALAGRGAALRGLGRATEALADLDKAI